MIQLIMIRIILFLILYYFIIDIVLLIGLHLDWLLMNIYYHIFIINLLFAINLFFAINLLFAINLFSILLHLVFGMFTKIFIFIEIWFLILSKLLFEIFKKLLFFKHNYLILFSNFMNCIEWFWFAGYMLTELYLWKK